MLTYADTLGKHNVTIPGDLLADMEVPILTAPQSQGDVAVWPRPLVGKAERDGFRPVPAEGLTIVQGDHRHILDAYQGDVFYKPIAARPGEVTIGVLDVPEGSVAYLTHTDEHGTNGIGPGTYRITGKREMADEIRRVAD